MPDGKLLSKRMRKGCSGNICKKKKKKKGASDPMGYGLLLIVALVLCTPLSSTIELLHSTIFLCRSSLLFHMSGLPEM